MTQPPQPPRGGREDGFTANHTALVELIPADVLLVRAAVARTNPNPHRVQRFALAPDALACPVAGSGWSSSPRALATGSVAERLAAGPAYEDRGLVFADAIGDPLSPDMLAASFRALKAAGLPRLTIHGLRHTFATLGLDADADVLDVAAMLGHSSPTITQAIYQHTRPERLRRASEAIEGAIFRA